MIDDEPTTPGHRLGRQAAALEADPTALSIELPAESKVPRAPPPPARRPVCKGVWQVFDLRAPIPTGFVRVGYRAPTAQGLRVLQLEVAADRKCTTCHGRGGPVIRHIQGRREEGPCSCIEQVLRARGLIAAGPAGRPRHP